MKAKTIKAVLRKKVDAWIASIEDASLRAAAKRDTIVTGGCIASMLLGEKVNDYDVYFRTQETTHAMAQYYLKRYQDLNPGHATNGKVEELEDVRGEPRVRIHIPSAGVAGSARDAGEYDEDVLDDPQLVAELTGEQDAPERKDYEPVFLSSNAITLAGKVQLILRFFGSPEDIHANYDFVHCTNWWESETSHLELRADAMQCLLSRTLVYQGSRYPVCSVFRMRKFINRGWRINAGQTLKMLLQVSDLDLTDVAVLEDQLTGVDVAFFDMLIQQLKARDSHKVDPTYLVEIIDRVFGE